MRVWNRQSFVKDPDTGKRQARLNPPEMWVTTEVPELRIIDAALWDRVKARQADIREAMNPAGVNDPARGRSGRGGPITCCRAWCAAIAAGRDTR